MIKTYSNIYLYIFIYLYDDYDGVYIYISISSTFNVIGTHRIKC